MSAPEGEILHVSDTALMTAACRALETARPDGFVRDPFAARLAGDRGMAIARNLPGCELMQFGVAVRSRFLDGLVAETVAEHGIETVVSVGAGLDTRPWRLEFPPGLRWIEVDFPAMLDYKHGLMASEQPKCRLERFSLDLNDTGQRKALWAAAGGASALMITEGLLQYLPGGTVSGLAGESAAASGIRYWLLDVTSPEMSKRIRLPQSVQNVREEGHLDGARILDAVRRNGWISLALRSYLYDVGFALDRIRAMFAKRPVSEPIQPLPSGDPSGVHLFGREQPRSIG